MKRYIILLTGIIAICFALCASTDFETKLRKFNNNKATAKIVSDSALNFKVAPWKCIMTYPNGSVSTIYFNRDGVRKACFGADSSMVAYKAGPQKKDYYERWKTYRNGETRWVQSWYQYGAGYIKSKDHRNYFYEPLKVDHHGNWLIAVDKWAARSPGYSRQMVYYDEEGFDADEDAWVDKRIDNLVNAVAENENPLTPSNILKNGYALIVKLLYFFGLFILFMLLFKRRKFYLWFDIKATRKITPLGNAIICKTQLAGIIPALILLFPIAEYQYTGHTTAVIHMSLVESQLLAVGLASIYYLLYILIRKRFVGSRCARWELNYALLMCLALFSAIILAIYIAVIALIVLFFMGMLFGKGGGISVDSPEDKPHYVTGVDGESAYLSPMGNGYFMDTDGNLFHHNIRLSDSKAFF